MDVLDVRQQIRDRKTDNFYIFTGEEGAIQSAYIRKLAEINGCRIKRIDSLSEIYSKRSNSMIKTKDCYVVMNDADAIKYEKSWADSLKSVLGKNMLILQFTSIDKRSKFYNTFKDIIVDFKYLPETILLKYVRRETALSMPYAKKLIEICENDYSRMMFEMDKIKQYAQAAGVSHDDALRELVEKDVIYVPEKDRAIDFIDAVAGGKITDSFKLLEECVESGEATLAMLSLLYSQMRRLLQVQGCQSKDIAGVTGLEDWEIRKSKNFCGVYSNAELVDALRTIRKVERGLKTGMVEEPVCLDYVLIKILGGWE